MVVQSFKLEVKLNKVLKVERRFRKEGAGEIKLNNIFKINSK